MYTCLYNSFNPRKIGIFVFEYTFSGALIKIIFRSFNPTKEHFYEFNGRIYLSVNISTNYSFISKNLYLNHVNIGLPFQGQ